MKSATCFWRFPLSIALIVAICHVTSAEVGKPDSDQHPSVVDVLPSFEDMLAIALKHNPNVRAAHAELDGVRLQVAKEIRAFRQDWEAERAALAAVKSAKQQSERLTRLDGAIAGRQVQEAKHALELAQKRAAQAEGKLKDMRLLLTHLLGREPFAKSDDKRRFGDAHHHGEGHHYHTDDDDVEQLLRERLHVLVEVAKFQQQAYKTAEVGFDAVAASQMDLLVARLELAHSPSERVRIRRGVLEIAIQIERVATQLYKANEATQVDMLKAKALRLRAAADLNGQQSTANH